MRGQQAAALQSAAAWRGTAGPGQASPRAAWSLNVGRPVRAPHRPSIRGSFNSAVRWFPAGVITALNPPPTLSRETELEETIQGLFSLC